MTYAHRRFGVEHESFILHDDGTPPGHNEIDHFYDQLQQFGYNICCSDAGGRILAVERQSEYGTVVISNECYTHVLEVAFPPLLNLDDFRRLYLGEYSFICAALKAEGIAIRAGAALNPPAITYARAKPTDSDGSRLKSVLARPVVDHQLFHPDLPACITATQVSLNISASEAIRKLPHFYNFELLVPLLFGNSPEFNGVRGWCMRPLALMANFSPSYSLLGIPTVIPASLSEYERMRQDSGIRDYSFVSIRSDHRLEFRSACSQNSVEDILQLIRFRLAVDLASTQSANFSQSNARDQFIQVCTSGPSPCCEEQFQRLVQVDPTLAQLAERQKSRSTSLGPYDMNH